MHTDTIHHFAALLREQERAFILGGALPPGVAFSDLPMFCLNSCLQRATRAKVDDFLAKRARIDELQRCFQVAHLERDPILTFIQRSQYRLACQKMDAFEAPPATPNWPVTPREVHPPPECV